jgi:uncharacterized RDD family membrane protein YckC
VSIGSWWSRFGASFLDGIIQLVAFVLLYGVAAALDHPAAWGVAVIGIAAVICLYAPLMLAYNSGQTWGKQALALRVTNKDGSAIGFGRAFVREFCLKTIPSFISPFNLVDYLWAAFRDDRRSLHDLGAGTVVVQA